MDSRFSISPQAYDAWFSTPQGRRILEEEQALFQRILWKERGSLLDIGCGTGIFTGFFKKLGFPTTGLDFSQEMLLHLKSKEPDIPLVRGNAQLLPFKKDSFQYATLITVLEFLPHPFYALVEATKVAQKGVAVAFLPPWSPTNLKRRVKALLGRSSFQQAHFLSFSRILSMIKEGCKANFRDVKRIEQGGCLFPRNLRLLSLASFAVIRVDYE